MRLFNRKPKHKHQWELIHTSLFIRSYEVRQVFRKPYQQDVEGIGKLYRCVGCGEEKAYLDSEIFKGEKNMGLWMAGGWGEVDPIYYRLRFLQEKEATNERR